MRVTFLVWLIGLFTAVPVAGWYLLYEAERNLYLPLIAFLVGWVFFFLPIMGALRGVIRAGRLLRDLRGSETWDEVREKIRSGEAEDVVISLIAAEQGVSRDKARRIYEVLRASVRRGQA